MTDKYFYTEDDKSTVTIALQLTDVEGNALPGIVTGCGGNYFQNAQFILLWVGKIPKTYDEDGNVLTYEANGAEHFNVRLLDDSAVSEFTGYTEIVPNTPYSVFA